MHNAWITTAGEKMSKSLGNTLSIPSVLQRVRGIELRFYMVAAHYRSHVEFSFEALEESAVGFRRIESFLERGVGDGRARASCPQAFVDAMNDDLGTPAAVAVALRRRARRQQRDAGRRPRRRPPPVVAMLDVLGLNPADPAWGPASSNDQQLTDAVDVLVRGLLEQRTQARADKDFAAADAIRDQIKAAGIEITDTPDGPCVVPGSRNEVMAGNSQRKGSIKKTGKGNPTAGSGGRVKRGLEGRGPTPQAKDRAVPQGLQEGQQGRQVRRGPAEEAPYRQHGRRVDRRAQLRRRGAARGRAGQRRVRRRGCRARRPAARGLRAGRRPRHQPARGDPQRARPDDLRRRPPGPRRADPVVRVRPRRRPPRPRPRPTARSR